METVLEQRSMEVIGAAASLVTLIATTIQTAKVIQSLISKYRNVFPRFNRINSDLEDTVVMLYQIQGLLSISNERSYTKVTSASGQTQTLLERYCKDMQELQNTIHKHGKPRAILGKISRSMGLDQETSDLVESRLCSLKQNLTLQLAVLGR